MKRIRLFIILIAGICFLMIAWAAYVLFFPSSGSTEKKIRVSKSWTMEILAKNLSDSGIVKSESNFLRIAAWMGYKQPASCFITVPGRSNLFQIIKLLKSNRRQTVDIVIKGTMSKEKLAELISSKIDVNQDSFLDVLNSGVGLEKLGVDKENWPFLFVPNTYNLYVATELAGFLEKMKAESDKFWAQGRIAKAEKQGLTPKEVVILASIVCKESNKTDEYEKIAGVYINRLRKGMLLQADPTVVFARGSSGLVSLADLKIPSPYNTYINKGLPPGPICIPNVSAIESVLNYTAHDYFYFVASADFSGYHTFAETYNQHLKYVADLRAARKLRDSQSNKN